MMTPEHCNQKAKTLWQKAPAAASLPALPDHEYFRLRATDFEVHVRACAKQSPVNCSFLNCSPSPRPGLYHALSLPLSLCRSVGVYVFI